MAAAAAPALRRLARHADGWLPISPGPGSYTGDWKKIQQECAHAGRDPAALLRVLYVTLNVNSKEPEAERKMEEFLHAYYGPIFPTIARFQGHFAGSPQRCAEYLKGFTDAGVQHFVIRFATAAQETQMERFFNDVVPLLA
jgi:alkanesulfonate monooxygenase SsuD/methylene tetrahydromethanopterin reductase-like flavin-dependent oxidoreductase (luciferase family)